VIVVSQSSRTPNPDPLALTPRRRRLRVLTVLVLLAVIAMVLYGTRDPFFALPSGPVVAAARHAVAVRALIILLYWTFCMFLGLSLVVLAWLDLREIRRALMAARRSTWRETVGKRHDRSDGGLLT
jgi:hypothetical protein